MEGLDHQRAVNLLKSVSGESLKIKHHLGQTKLCWLTIIRLKNSQYSFGHFEHVQTIGLSSLHLKTASIGLLSITFFDWFVIGYMYMYI